MRGNENLSVVSDAYRCNVQFSDSLPAFESLEPRLLLSTMTISVLTQFTTLDNGVDDADATPGIFEPVNDDLVIATGGSINNNDDFAGNIPNDSARPIMLHVRGNLTIEAGGGIFAENRNQGGVGGDITIVLGGGLLMEGASQSDPGAVISSSRIGFANAGTKNAGDITILMLGTFTMEDGSIVRANDPGGKAGDITIQSGGTEEGDPSGHMFLDGLISAGPTDNVLDTKLTGFVLERGNTTDRKSVV